MYTHTHPRPCAAALATGKPAHHIAILFQISRYAACLKGNKQRGPGSCHVHCGMQVAQHRHARVTPAAIVKRMLHTAIQRGCRAIMYQHILEKRERCETKKKDTHIRIYASFMLELQNGCQQNHLPVQQFAGEQLAPCCSAFRGITRDPPYMNPIQTESQGTHNC
jgi:hypothetical protein